MPQKSKRPLPRVVKLYMLSAAIGFIVAAVFTGLILWFNIANLQHLVLTSDVGAVAIIAFWILNGIVFSGVQFGYYMMRLAAAD